MLHLMNPRKYEENIRWQCAQNVYDRVNAGHQDSLTANPACFCISSPSSERVTHELQRRANLQKRGL